MGHEQCQDMGRGPAGLGCKEKNENMGTFFRKGVGLREYIEGKEKLTSLKGKKK